MKKTNLKKLKFRKNNFTKPALTSFAVASAMAVLTYDARANVYATDIQVNGNFPPMGSVAAALGTPVSISYHLNQAATLGVTVYIMQGNTIVATVPGGTAMGLNSVSWTPSSPGTFSVSIMAAAADVSGGTTNWTQISVDGANTTAVYPWGIDVDKNTNSPYYGRVIVGNSIDATQHGVTQKVGLYKFNSDSSPADEGSFGYAGYTTNDQGFTAVGEMPEKGQTYHNYLLPNLVRIGGDDRIYFIDTSEIGAVIATDMQATTNQIVINEGPGGFGPVPASGGYPSCPNNYSHLATYASLLNATFGPGFGQFEVAGFETGHPAVYISDYQDIPNAGIWEFHLVNGAADPADQVGTAVIDYPMGFTDPNIINPYGFSIDTNLDVFIGQNRYSGSDSLDRVFEFAKWNGGVLPAEAQSTADQLNDSSSTWKVGSADPNLAGVQDVALNSQTAPTLLGVAMGYSAPVTAFTITSITAVPTGSPGCSTVTIKFTSPESPAASALSVYESSTVNGTYTALAGATITGGSGSYQAVFTSCSTSFYVIETSTDISDGLAVLNATTGAYVAHNVDPANFYTAVAFDHVGNVYGTSTTANYWRVWSPPGANTNTTVALENIVVSP